MARRPMTNVTIVDAPVGSNAVGTDTPDVPGGYLIRANADGSMSVRGEDPRAPRPEDSGVMPGIGLPRALDHELEPRREDLDRYLIRTRDRVGAGIQFAIAAPGPLADLVCVSWYSKRAGFPRRSAFCASLRDCLDHVHAYEDIAESKGEQAAEFWQRQQRVQSEAAAIAKRDELARRGAT